MSNDTEARLVIVAEPIEDHSAELSRLGVDPGECRLLTRGIMTATAETEWVGVEPLPAGQMFDLRSWDEPVERELGWESFEDCPWVANARNLVAFWVSA